MNNYIDLSIFWKIEVREGQVKQYLKRSDSPGGTLINLMLFLEMLKVLPSLSKRDYFRSIIQIKEYTNRHA